MQIHIRSISDVIAVLGLLTVAVIAVVIGYTIIMNYLSQSFKPSYQISVTYAKLIFITASESIGGTVYATYKGEIGISNPGNPTSVQICIVAAKVSGTSVSPTTFVGSYSCPTISIDSGYNAYSFIIRISLNNLTNIGCSNMPQQCPIVNQFYFVIKDSQGNVVDVVKPVYVVP